MRTELPTTNERVVAESTEPVPAPDGERVLRAQAIKQIERVRSFKLHLASFVVGIVILTGIWALTEYLNADGWPERFSDEGGPETWNPWIFWVVLVWGLILSIHGVRTHFQRPPTEAEVERELERLKSGS